MLRTAMAALVLGLLSPVLSVAPAQADNVVTPGDFTGYGFDQCHTPDQRSMNRWLKHSPFWAAGIYISGNSRACRDQPNLTPEWVATQLANGWRLLPITLGPQASCQPRFPRYNDDPKINPKRGTDGRYQWARDQGTAEATKTVQAAQALGITAGSTLWYDLEGFNVNLGDCRESALAFMSNYTDQLHALGYVSGLYSSASSGIKMFDDARVERPGLFTLPDRLWIARWDGLANTSTSYIREDGWRPGGRMKQYQGGHDETWGGVRINIDRNYLDLGLGSIAAPETHCGGVTVDFYAYRPISPKKNRPVDVAALQCLLTERGGYAGPVDGAYSPTLRASIAAWLQTNGRPALASWSRSNWVALLSQGAKPVLKVGSAGSDVRRLQRALNAANPQLHLGISGVYDASTEAAVRAYQADVSMPVSGIVAPNLWRKLWRGVR